MQNEEQIPKGILGRISQLPPEQKKLHYSNMTKYHQEALLERAKNVGFKDIIPTYPLSQSEPSIRGYLGRLFNWTKKLEHMEHCAYLNYKKQNLVNITSNDFVSLRPQQVKH